MVKFLVMIFICSLAKIILGNKYIAFILFCLGLMLYKWVLPIGLGLMIGSIILLFKIES